MGGTAPMHRERKICETELRKRLNKHFIYFLLKVKCMPKGRAAQTYLHAGPLINSSDWLRAICTV